MTALTDSISWGATPGATGYTVGVRDTTAPASQAGHCFWFATSLGPRITVGQLARGALQNEPLPTGVMLAAAVQSQVVWVDINGMITGRTLSDWSAEITFTVEPAVVPDTGPVVGKSAGVSMAQAPAQPALAAPAGLAIG